MEFNFEGLEIQKWNISADRTQRVDKEMGSLVSCYGHKNVKNGSFFVFSAYNSKKLVTVWARYLNAPGRSYWILNPT